MPVSSFTFYLLAAVLLVVSTDAWAPSSSSSSFKSNKQKPLHQSSRALDIPSSTTDSADHEASAVLQQDEAFDFGMPPMGTVSEHPTSQETLTEIMVDHSPPQATTFTPFQQFARTAPLVVMAAYAVKPEPWDAATQSVWSWIYSWDITHTGLFEAHVASFSFVAFIAAFSCAHLALQATSRNSQELDDKMAQYRLDGTAPVEDPLKWATPAGFSEWFNPLTSYLVSIWIYQQVFHTYNEPPPLAPAFGVLVVEVMVGVFLYDLLFAPVHLLLHKGPLKDMRAAHGYHHRHAHGSLNPVETVQHSYLDGGLQVMVNILVQHVTPFGGPKHMMSRLIHNIIVTYLLTESHSGYNFGWMSHNLWPGVLGGAPRHDGHHKDGRVYYQHFFCYLDNFFGWTTPHLHQQLLQKQQEKVAKLEMEELALPSAEEASAAAVTSDTIA